MVRFFRDLPRIFFYFLRFSHPCRPFSPQDTGRRIQSVDPYRYSLTPPPSRSLINWRIPWLRGSRAIYLARMRPRVSTRGETDVASRDSGCRPAPKCRLNYQHAVIYTATLDRWRAGLKTRASDTRDILYSPAVWDRTHPHQSAGRWWWTYQFSSSPRSADVPWWLMKSFQETLKIIARRLEIGKRRCDVCHCW